MKNLALQKAILRILDRLNHVALRESTLAAEAEIAVDRPLTTGEFADELRFLEMHELIKRDFDSFDETLGLITDKGSYALRGL